MAVKRGIEDGTDDTEGNTVKVRPAPAIESDDTEGNAAHGRFVDDGVESDDTEGNGACVRH